MAEQPVLAGAHFQAILGKEPLNDATFLCQGSSSMLFERGDRLYRLTLEGCGHNFLAQQWADGNRNVVEIIHDYGAVGPSDASFIGSENEFYWLAEVERLISVDEVSEPLLAGLLSGLLDDNDDLPANSMLAEQCHALADQHPALAGVFITLARSAKFAQRHDCDVDARIDNIMRRPATGELVWTDPLGGCLYEPIVYST